MNTGQLCSHGTRDALGAKDQKAEQWVAVARKYNGGVKEATAQLMEDAEELLDAEQMMLLKTWFAEGFNKEINQLLHSKGLGSLEEQSPASDTEEKH